MADHGEWNRKGATLSDVTAEKEYGIDREFIIKGIQAGRLEYREGAVWGNPYLRLLRNQLERYIADELGEDHLARRKTATELQKVTRGIAKLKKELAQLETRKAQLEKESRR